MATDQVFIYTMNRGVQGGAWSRYIFPWTIEHFAHLENTLYMRHGDIVSYAIEDVHNDDGQPYEGVIQWPWLDFGAPGTNKLLDAFDIVGYGPLGCKIQIGYDQGDLNAFTVEYDIPSDSLNAQIIPLPLTAPTMSVKLTFPGLQDWQWNALQLYLIDNRPRS